MDIKRRLAGMVGSSSISQPGLMETSRIMSSNRRESFRFGMVGERFVMGNLLGYEQHFRVVIVINEIVIEINSVGDPETLFVPSGNNVNQVFYI